MFLIETLIILQNILCPNVTNILIFYILDKEIIPKEVL